VTTVAGLLVLLAPVVVYVVYRLLRHRHVADWGGRR
jgi:hypothetical protein